MSWAEIKKAINSDLSTPLNDIIDVIDSKIDTLDTKVNSLPTGAIKSIQRGSTTLSSAVNNTTASITAVNTAKTFIIVTNDAGATLADSIFIRSTLNSSTQLLFERISSSGPVNIEWQVIEYI